jgi:hypothetical protein
MCFAIDGAVSLISISKSVKSAGEIIEIFNLHKMLPLWRQVYETSDYTVLCSIDTFLYGFNIAIVGQPTSC